MTFCALFEDPPRWDHTTQTGPVIAHWTIEPGEPQPGKTRPGWKVLMELTAPPDWTLATASSGTAVIERVSSQPLILVFTYHQGFPPLAPGPSLDTQWKTPVGTVSLRFDPELSWSATEEVVPSSPNPSTSWMVDWPLLSLGLVWVVLLCALANILWIRLRQVSHRWARKWWRSQPKPGSPWGDWEIWLAHLDRDHRGRAMPNHPQTGPLWQEIGTLLPDARFGKPENRSWATLMGKLKIMGNLDNLAKQGEKPCR